EVPGGKLTTTWARRYEDYPVSEEYGYLNGNLEKEEYREGIFVGYRYFDSFDKKVLFPFGFGLSYTSFEIKCCGMNMEEGKLRAEVQVTNTGKKYAGKEVVQIYVTLPQTGLEKEYKRLAGFAKTRLLKPEETQTLIVEISQKQLASFCEETHTWIIEKGSYGILIGNSSDKLEQEAVLVISDTSVLEHTDAICPLQEELRQIHMSEELREKLVQQEKELKTAQVPQYCFKPVMLPEKSENDGENQENLTEEEKRLFSALEGRSVEELIPLLYGKISENISTLGAAGIRVPGSAGETSGALEEDGIPSLVMADGPAGIRLRQWYEVDKETDSIYEMGVLGSLENGILEPGVHHENADTYYQYCTAFPVGTALAQTWDTDLMTEFGKAIAEEMEEFHVNLWLAPGMNIHRNPLCGRNYEYYSEDPYLSGMLAAAVTRGVQSKSGCGVTIKHFACNNQEDNRMGVDSCVSERALREIYLRGFEIAVKEGNPVSIMTSYNLINGIHAANSKDLCMTVARKEWGFDGAIMSDWNTTVPENGSVPWKCVAAGNDIIMPGNPDDDKNIRQAYKEGKLTEEEIRNCAGHLVSMIRRLERTDC
ncbi:MAG: glycoside hydrolase family 3 N-terminal domain-containing protein, partial [Ruminococcus sp.]|nr:glycoside hydrolase family 3 N-terminal domain-containing protein [Ruminococcus sp.]